ncbi:MAG: 3-phosphoshikimate 1-carboxyvinyltransferase [Methylacidiphilales bacterium]|nr:3-phosphoshikimate 1-carboxyvinyltransferase [Candidatus Methylacidiphilales bacterium]
MSRPPASTLAVRPIRHISGELSVPGDKSLSHRAVLFSALADGTTVITGFRPGEDCVCTMRALQAMGASIEVESKTSLIVHGTSGKLQPPLEPLDCGNSGTAMRLMAGILAAQPFGSRLIGDASLSGRPMKRIVDPLRLMGAKIQGRGQNHTAPLEIEGGSLTGIDYTLPVASAQLKSCLLLAGLFANGTTSVTEKTPTRDHTERLLAHFHAPPVIDLHPESAAKTVRVRGGSRLHARDFKVPGDFSSAAFWIAAAAAFPGSDLTITNLGLNGTRTGLLSVLLRMGAHLQETISDSSCEPAGVVRVFGRKLRGTRVAGVEIANVIDELPIIAVTAALAEGPTEIRDARELRVKETDRIAAMAKNLRAFGVPVDEHDDGMTIHGGAPINAAKVGSFGDHRIAMSCAILGLFAKGETVIEDTNCIATSYPTFREDLVKIAYFQDTGFASLLSPRR